MFQAQTWDREALDTLDYLCQDLDFSLAFKYKFGLDREEDQGVEVLAISHPHATHF